MHVTPGDRLGPYEILSRIGAGGMGEVWKARDTRLGREVAVKVSADQFSDRFEREARAVAALNHPNICVIHDVGLNYLVMELIEGPTLADRIRQGPIPANEALAFARQIAEALDAAHEKGIVHRDLKPANIKVKSDGTVKVLDFGLAKIADPAPSSSADLENSPTLTLEQATRVGTIMGTAAYMSPEQARGKAVDKRADIWAFGVVLHEMLTGKRLFDGETVSDTLAHVITKEPALEQVPDKVRRLLQRCLEKDTKKRLRDIGDAMILLDEAPEPSAALSGASSSPRWLWGLATLAFVIAAVLGVMRLREKPPAPPPVTRFQIRLPDQVRFTGGTFTLSPDGRHLAFSAVGPNQPPAVWVQDLDALEAHPLPGTFTGLNPPPFFWSPDSRFVVYSENSPKLRKADLTGGPIQDLCEKPNPPVGGSWNRDGVIIFGSTNNEGLWRVPAAGGKPVPLTVLDASRHERQHELPQFLPDGHHFLYLSISNMPEESGIYIGSLDNPPDHQNKTRLLATEFGAGFVPSADGGPGRLLYLQEGTLMAQPFDPGSLKLGGSPRPVAERVGSVFQTGFFAAAPTALVYRAAPTPRDFQMTWYDAQGKPGEKVGDPGMISELHLSPDGTRVAYRITAANLADSDIWILDLARGASTRLTFGPHLNEYPIWSPDGTEIVFASNRDGVYNLYRKPANGSKEEELLLRTNENKRPTSWSRDGKFLLYAASSNASFADEDIWVLPLEGERQPFAFAKTRFDEGSATFSPDGRWVAYYSNETGPYETYVREFVPPPASSASGGKWMVSLHGGAAARWREDGRELVYYSVLAPRALLSVSVQINPVFSAGVPRELFRVPGPGPGAPSNDLKRFLLTVPVEQHASEFFTVMLNWSSGLNAR